MQPVDRQECLVIAEKISYKDVHGLLNVSWEQGLLPGTYRAVQENAVGTFYRGEGRSFFQANEWMRQNSQYMLRKGGAWLPKASRAKPRLYWYFEPETYLASGTDIDSQVSQQASNAVSAGYPAGASVVGSAIGIGIVNAFIESSRGEITMWHEISDEKFAQILLQSLKTGPEASICPTKP
ncbi:hypothetical protein GCM10007907_30260 [Chitinimonas prasina]|uniref:Uncharacterized protein n=1 Tax=Chitinimonas prasina TaxID=1434937 RepID=A0ABQ5YLU3_9NEIS|nr:hypothetical protein GCM10007907_30260 [Chitinimonas prasina]